VFGSVWDSTLPDKRASLGRLFATWTGVFGPDVLERVKVHMAAPGVPQLLPQQPQVLLQPQPVQVFQGGYTATGTGPAVVTLPPGAYVSAMPQPVVSLAPQPFGSGGGAPIQVQYLPPAQVQQYVAPPQAVAGLVPGMQPPPSPPHAGWQQSQPALDPRLRRRSPSPMIVGGWPGQQQQQQQQQPGVMPAQLSDLLSSLAQTGVLRGAPPAYNREDPVLRTTEMTPAYIKVTVAADPPPLPRTARPACLRTPSPLSPQVGHAERWVQGALWLRRCLGRMLLHEFHLLQLIEARTHQNAAYRDWYAGNVSTNSCCKSAERATAGRPQSQRHVAACCVWSLVWQCWSQCWCGSQTRGAAGLSRTEANHNQHPAHRQHSLLVAVRIALKGAALLQHISLLTTI
jgi:hypothetical protein